MRGIGRLAPALAMLCAQACAQGQAGLLARYESLKPALASNAFQRPLHLESTQTSGDLQGDVYAVVEQPYATVVQSLQRPEQWCEVLILHLNVKGCHAEPGPRLAVSVGKKTAQALDDAYEVAFDYRVAAAGSDYLRVGLDADKGPLGTNHYRIAFEAAPLDERRSFVHLSYAYAYGMAARLAMQGYLATVGRDKVGFSVTGRDGRGQPVFVTGMRGVVERNTMRYYLAIDAYLGSLGLPPGEQLPKRLADWFAATERYPRQLHEVERSEYLAAKREEANR